MKGDIYVMKNVHNNIVNGVSFDEVNMFCNTVYLLQKIGPKNSVILSCYCLREYEQSCLFKLVRRSRTKEDTLAHAYFISYSTGQNCGSEWA